MIKVITNKKVKQISLASLLRAREKKRLNTMLPSGACIPFTFFPEKQDYFFVVGRGKKYTYLIFCSPWYLHKEVSEASLYDGKLNALARKQLFLGLPETIQKLAIPFQKNRNSKDICIDTTLLLPSEKIFSKFSISCYDNEEYQDDMEIDFALSVIDAFKTQDFQNELHLIDEDYGNMFFGICIGPSTGDYFSDTEKSNVNEAFCQLIEEKKELHKSLITTLSIITIITMCAGTCLAIYIEKMQYSPAIHRACLTFTTVITLYLTLFIVKEYYKYVKNEKKEIYNEPVEDDSYVEAGGEESKNNEDTQDTEAYFNMLYEYKNKIIDAGVVKQLQQIEDTLKRIIKKEENDPETSNNTRKLMEYYMPTTIKLLQAYIEVENNPRKGANALKIMKETEDALRMLNETMENILDNMYLDTELDLASDIEVMKNLMLQDGVKGGFTELQSSALSADENNTIN